MSVQSIPVQKRWISLIELLLGSFFVIGHNVLHIVPNEVPILFALFWISLRLRESRWNAPNLRRPKSWIRTAAVAVVAAAALQLGSEFAIGPLAAHLTHTTERVSAVFRSPAHDWHHLWQTLALVWTFAAFGEEIGYRGYLLERAGEAGGQSRIAWWIALLLASVLFGFGHFYKGPAGVMVSTYSGLILGGTYLLCGRNLWAPILAHGISDTFAALVVFLGLAS